MFADALPPWVNTNSARVNAGLGTIARVVASGEAIYRGKITFAEAERRIETCWKPFHEAVSTLIDGTRAEFGQCVLIDCHSMPSHVPVSGRGDRLADIADSGRRAWHGLRPAASPDLLSGRLDRSRLSSAPERSLRRGVHHPPLRPAAPAGAHLADRNRPRSLYGRGAVRAVGGLHHDAR